MLEVLNEKGVALASLQRFAEGGQEPTLRDNFASTYCGDDVFVVVIGTPVSTGISSGTLYDNILFNADGEIIAEYSGGEVVDSEDGSVISDDQPELEASLRAGVDDPERCGAQ